MSDPAPRRLLSATTLARLERQRLRAVGGARRARREGESRSAGRGGFAEFVDHRAYEPGDDLRRIDWALDARLDRLFVKEFAREVEPEEWIVADASASMAVPPGKALAARRLVFALAFVALRSARTVRLVAAGRAAAMDAGRPLSSSASIAAAERRAADFEFDPERPAGAAAGDLAGDLRRLRERLRGPAGVTVVSDLLFDGEPLVRELVALRSAGHDVAVLHLLAREDVVLEPIGRARFRAAEGGGPPLDLDAGAAASERFAGIAFSFVEGWRRVCRAHGLRHVLLRPDATEEEVLVNGLRRVLFVPGGAHAPGARA